MSWFGPGPSSIATPVMPASDSANFPVAPGPASGNFPVGGAASGSSSSAYGTATAPGAGAAIATTGVLAAGTYRVSVVAGYGGTADVVDNMDLRVGGVSLSKLFVPAVANGPGLMHHYPRVSVSGGQAITVNAVAAGGVSTVFRAVIIFTPVA